MTTSNRKAIVTDVHRNEARALKAIWDKVRPTSQKEFGREFGIGGQSAVGNFLTGTSALSMKAAVGFAAGLGCRIEDFSPRLAAEAGQIAEVVTPTQEEHDFQDVMRIDARLAGGDGAVQGLQEVIGNLKFTTSFLRACKVSPKKARVVDVRGHSMHPTIPDGAVVLIDTGAKEPEHNCIFALARPVEGLIVKRLKKTDEGWIAFSDNPANKPIPINDGEPITIVGRAVWMGATL